MIRNLTRQFFSQQKSFIALRNKATSTSVSEKGIEDLTVLELNEGILKFYKYILYKQYCMNKNRI